VGFKGMRKEVMAMQAARAKRADERKEETPFRRWSVVYILSTTRSTGGRGW
jgi:hypothetical protein